MKALTNKFYFFPRHPVYIRKRSHKCSNFVRISHGTLDGKSMFLVEISLSSRSSLQDLPQVTLLVRFSEPIIFLSRATFFVNHENMKKEDAPRDGYRDSSLRVISSHRDVNVASLRLIPTRRSRRIIVNVKLERLNEVVSQN